MQWMILKKKHNGQIVAVAKHGKMAQGRPWASEELVAEVYAENEVQALSQVQEGGTPGGGVIPR